MLRFRPLLRLGPYLDRHRGALGGGLLCLFLTAGLAATSPWVLRHAVDDLTAGLTREKLWFWAGLLLVLVIAEGGFRFLMRRVLIGMSREVEFELRQDLFVHFTRLPLSYYQSHRVGDAMSRATSDVSAVRMVVGPGIMYTANTVATSAAALVMMARISPLLLGLALIPLVFVTILVRQLGRRIHDGFESVQDQLAEMSVLVQESLAGARVVRAYAQEPHEIARFEAVNAEYVDRNRTLIRVYGALYPAVQLLMGLGAVTVLWLGGRLVAGGGITLGEFVAFGSYLTMLQWPMIAVGWVVNLFERGAASMGRLTAILDVPPGIDDAHAGEASALGGAVEFRNLTFAYGDGPPVLHNVDLRVPAGATVAVVGPTGSGKSTLVNLLPRLHEAPPGTVFVDAHEVRALPLAVLRGAVGFVPQESFLFSATVRENVALGVADPGDPRVEWAAGVARLALDVADFPAGYDTRVGERGITLSGGQRQRVALARALARDPRILVLDDALSAVDTRTEEEILAGLRGVMRSRTTFLVSHRVSTVREADLIVVLREGRITERGTHAELVRAGGFYAELHRRQQLEDEVAIA